LEDEGQVASEHEDAVHEVPHNPMNSERSMNKLSARFMPQNKKNKIHLGIEGTNVDEDLEL